MPRSRFVPTLILALALAGCTLPGAASPTPFSFPTPDLTLTALAAPVETKEPPTAVIVPSETEEIDVPTATATVEEGTPSTLTLTPTISTQDIRPNGTPASAAKLETPPEIDGGHDEWEGSPIVIDKNVYGAANWSGIEDTYGHFFVGWDETALYLAVSVIDDAFVQVSSGRTMFKGDIIELQLDVDLQGDYFSNRLSSDDYQIGLSPGNFGSIGNESYRWYPVVLAGTPPGVSVAAISTEGGYDLEAAIPWTVFGISPEEGDSFGFALSISDNDLAGQAVQQSMVSSVKSRTLTNPTTWGTLVLGP